MLRSSLVRAGRLTPSIPPPGCTRSGLRAVKASPTVCIQKAHQSHAISNPTLANIEKRWEEMEPQEQAELWMSLRDRMKSDWHEMTIQEKKASYWIAFGPHGPRALPPPGEKKKIFLYTVYGLIAATLLFGATRAMAQPPPHTMTKEWQEATEEYMKSQRMEPITGRPGMMVQSKPGVKTLPEDED